MPGPNETRLNLIDGVEYFTVRADDVRPIMRERDELRAEVERLRAALEKHHDHLSDEPGDHCRKCGLDYLARPKEES